MKIKIKKKPRIFNVNVGNSKIQLNDTASIMLKKNEQVTFKYLGSEYDVAKKDWGYYATPSINGRLQNFGFKTFLTQNKFKKIYVNLVHSNKMKTFKKYLKKEKSKVLIELTNFK